MSRARIVLFSTLVLAGLVAFLRPLARSDPSPPPRSTLDTLFAVGALDTEAGIRQFDARVREDPRDFISLTILGQLYARKARDRGEPVWLRRAEEAFRHALRLKPDHTPASANLAAAYVAQHRFADGLAIAQDVYTQFPSSLDVLATLADIYLETGRYREAEEAVATLERRAGNDAAILARRAAMAEVKGRTAQTVALLDRAATLMEQQAQAGIEIAWFRSRLGDVYFHSGCLQEAEQQFEGALGLSGSYPFGLTGLGDVRVVQGRLEEALDLYRRSVSEAPVPRRLFALAALEERLDLVADAKRHREEGEALARDPNGVPAAYYRDLALFLADQVGRSAEAVEFAQKDLALRQDVRAYDTLAWALYRNRRFDEAADAVARALQMGTRDADFFYHAGMIHQARGEQERARSYFDQALQLRPRRRDGPDGSGECRLQS
jgi:tetratricopeptide (TPR) repeat protein